MNWFSPAKILHNPGLGAVLSTALLFSGVGNANALISHYDEMDKHDRAQYVSLIQRRARPVVAMGNRLSKRILSSF